MLRRKLGASSNDDLVTLPSVFDDLETHNKNVKLRNFELIGRKGNQRIEHTIVRRVISLEEIVAENLSRVKACCCDEFVVGDVLR